MSILSDVLSVLDDMVSLVLIRSCIICNAPMLDDDGFACVACQHRIPLTHFTHRADNPVEQHFRAMLPIEHASSLYWFVGESQWAKVVYKFKYAGRWAMAWRMGEWLGSELYDGGLYGDVDVIVPIPLHKRRRLMRGYNQAEMLALGVSNKLGVPYEFKAVKRVQYNESQTQKRRMERWENVSDIFAVPKPEKLRGRHILIVDDVLTTGATITACAKTIYEACEGDVRISIATLAASPRSFG